MHVIYAGRSQDGSEVGVLVTPLRFSFSSLAVIFPISLVANGDRHFQELQQFRRARAFAVASFFLGIPRLESLGGGGGGGRSTSPPRAGDQGADASVTADQDGEESRRRRRLGRRRQRDAAQCGICGVGSSRPVVGARTTRGGIAASPSTSTSLWGRAERRAVAVQRRWLELGHDVQIRRLGGFFFPK